LRPLPFHVSDGEPSAGAVLSTDAEALDGLRVGTASVEVDAGSHRLYVRESFVELENGDMGAMVGATLADRVRDWCRISTVGVAAAISARHGIQNPCPLEIERIDPDERYQC